MFQKVIVVEDIDSISLSVARVLDELGVATIEVVKYCDDAWTKIKLAHDIGAPYQLVLTDLSFEKDYRAVTLSGGAALLEAVHAQYPELKTLVYSIEDKTFRIKKLYNDFGLWGYVLKGRRSLEKLKVALQTLAADKLYYDPELQAQLRDQGFVSLDAYEILLLQQLAAGSSLDEMEQYCRDQGVKPCSKSAIEKRLYRIRDAFEAKNLTHLVGLVKDRGVV